jgi:hypothetical protein
MIGSSDLEFQILSEDWTRYRLLPDDTILGVRIAVTKLLQKDTETGDPGYVVIGLPVLSVKAPESLLKRKGDIAVQTSKSNSAQSGDGTKVSDEKWMDS